MKILFLDIDGVLNNARTTERIAWRGARMVGIDAGLCAELQRAIDATGAKVVISSTWRKHFTRDEMRAHLANAGLRAEVISETPQIGSREREIEAWVVEHPEITAWCAIDDLPLGIDSAHFVQTYEPLGVTGTNVDEVIALLNREAAPVAKEVA